MGAQRKKWVIVSTTSKKWKLEWLKKALQRVKNSQPCRWVHGGFTSKASFLHLQELKEPCYGGGCEKKRLPGMCPSTSPLSWPATVNKTKTTTHTLIIGKDPSLLCSPRQWYAIRWLRGSRTTSCKCRFGRIIVCGGSFLHVFTTGVRLSFFVLSLSLSRSPRWRLLASCFVNCWKQVGLGKNYNLDLDALFAYRHSLIAYMAKLHSRRRTPSFFALRLPFCQEPWRTVARLWCAWTWQMHLRLFYLVGSRCLRLFHVLRICEPDLFSIFR